MIKKISLPHQAAFMQAPHIYKKHRFFFLIAGYASGKTAALVDSICMTVKELSGKRDREGNTPKIGVCGITLTFLKKTLVGRLVEALRQSETEFNYDKAHNIIYVAGVELHLTPIINEEEIFGFDWCLRGDTQILTKTGRVEIQDIEVGTEVLTRSGYKRVTRKWATGVKEVRQIHVGEHSVWATGNHKFFTVDDGYVEAQNLTNLSRLATIDDEGVYQWQDILGQIEKQTLLNSTESGTTVTRSLLLTVREAISHALMTIKNSDTQHIIGIYGKRNMVRFLKEWMSTIKTEIHLTILSKILSYSAEASIFDHTTPRELRNRKKHNEKECTMLSRYDKNSNEQKKAEKKHPVMLWLDGIKLLMSSTHAWYAESISIVGQKIQTIALRHAINVLTTENMLKMLSRHASSVERFSQKEDTQNQKHAHGTAQPRYLVETYDIEVEDEHEFFANGILVHNCSAFVDELDELPIYKSVAVVKAINDRCRQTVKDFRSPFLAFATTSQGLKGTYQVVDSFKKRGIGFVLIRARTKDNVFLPKSYVEAQYRIYNEKEQKCLLEGEFISIDQGLVYPDYDPVYNRTSEDLYLTVLPEEKVYIGQDFNTGFFKAVACVVRNGIMYVVKEYNFPDIRSAPEVFRYDFPENKIYWIPDATYNLSLPQFRNELHSCRINVIRRAKNPLVRDRVFLINKLFYTQRLVIPEYCIELDTALSQRQNDKKTGLPEKGSGENAPDHVSDSLEYVAFYLVSQLRSFMDLYKVTVGRRITKQLDAGLTTEKDQKYVVKEEIDENAVDIA